MLRRRAAEGKRPHSANTTLVCRIGSIDSQFFPGDFPSSPPRELCTAFLNGGARQFMPGSADIGFVLAGNVLLVPHMNENTVASYDLSEGLK